MPSKNSRPLRWFTFLLLSVFLPGSGAFPLAEHYVPSAGSSFEGYCDLRSGGFASRAADSNPFVQRICRVGEAQHPGPPLLLDDDLQDLSEVQVPFGCTNPSGLRQKEALAVELGAGVWGLSETQLSQATLPASIYQLRSLASTQNRRLRVHAGPGVKTRSTSTWAGSWSGVLTMSDFPSQPVALPWTADMFSTGRVLTTRHLVHNTPVLHTVLYGFPKGPTFPKALELTTRLLNVLSHEIVIGYSGVRMIVGDYNVSSTDLAVFDLWRSYGWRSAQEAAAELWGWTPRPTSKHRCERDLIWLSPEALALMRDISVSHTFAEHATLTVKLGFPTSLSPLRTWYRPAKIPWHLVQESWSADSLPPWQEGGTAEEQYSQIFAAMEVSLTGHLDRDHNGLLDNEKGRAQKCHAEQRASMPPIARPSRHGEVVMRNNLLSTVVTRWFKQLRRLEALRHSIAANSGTDNAHVYQLETWSAILRAPGFEAGFRSWWNNQRLNYVGVNPGLNLPWTIPTHEQISSIFEDFHYCYQCFESWHLRQRGQLLTAKHDRSMKRLYQELRAPRKEGPDLLYYDREYLILAVDPDSAQVHLDKPLDTRGSSTWKLDEEEVKLTQIDGDLCTIEPFGLASVDSVLYQRQFLSDVHEVHHDLLSHWEVRWNAHQEPSDSDWQRITAFFVSFIPKIHFDLPVITVTKWKTALKRYGPTAARGVDGVSHEDLLRLPDSLTQHLLGLLCLIENGESGWPRQLLYGVVISLAKVLDAHQAGSFRPVVIFGTVYRTWASIRSKQLIQQLAPHIPGSCFGFMPQGECAQLWMCLQASVELALMDGTPWCGLSTDLHRAFNTIPRRHSLLLSRRLGIPSTVLTPWHSFLNNCTRSFQVGPYLSRETRSSVGMPEGCSLSVMGMLQLTMSLHVYMKHFSAMTWTMSYVDNICLAAESVGQLAQAWVCLQSFFELWQMIPDKTKSYTWAVQASMRQQLSVFELPSVTHATELGGALTFSSQHRDKHLHARLEPLADLWSRLKRSKAPLVQRMLALPSVFWPKALHGNEAALLHGRHFSSLRTQAVKALGLAKAGVNPILRLTLSSRFENDPEYFHLRRTLHAFRRLCKKEPMTLTHWSYYMRLFDGNLRDGPFSKLLHLCSQIGWELQPPQLLDHDRCAHDLIQMDSRVLDQLLEDAWLQEVARRVSARTTMNDLHGLDPALSAWSHSNLTMQDTCLVASLQSGAFIGSAAHAKFDLTKTGQCEFCSAKDEHQHWLECPGYASLHTDESLMVPWMDLQVSIKAHMLPSRNPWAAQMKQLLLSIPDESASFLSTPGGPEQHIFCDGACTQHVDPLLCRSAWAVLNADTGFHVAAGLVPGLRQTIDVAELYGLLAALQWAAHFQVRVICWLDSAFVVRSVLWLQQHGDVPSQWHNQDLWHRVKSLLEELADLSPHVCWIPSHVDESWSTDPFDDWWIRWNARGDKAAVQSNSSRPTEYWRCFDAMKAHHEATKDILSQLREFYLKVAKLESTSTRLESLPELPEPSENAQIAHFGDLICIGWKHLLIEHFAESPHFPLQFCCDVFTWLGNNEQLHTAPIQVSFLELTLCLVQTPGFRFPFLNSQGSWELWHITDRMERPTVAYLLGMLKRVLVAAFRVCSLDGLLLRKIDLTSMAVAFPCEGMWFSLDRPVLASSRSLLVEFTRSRALRKACDLARPCC